MGYIKQKKQQFRQQRTQKAISETSEKAKELKKLREQRLALEGQANIRRLEQSERSKIQAAKGPSNIERFGVGLAKVINQGKTAGTKFKKSQNERKRGQSVSSGLARFGSINQGSRGVAFGGNSSPFDIGPTAPKKKKKSRDITIRISR